MPNGLINVHDSHGLKTSDVNTIYNSKINGDKRSSQLQIKSRHSIYMFSCLQLTANDNGDNDAEHDKIQEYFKDAFLV